MDEREKLDAKKNELIEQLGILMEKKHQIAPIAARIISTLILTGKHGVTFDELVKDLNASKSTVSTHLDHLQHSRKIQYFTKPGDRKRYFIINPHLLMAVIDETVAAWECEENVQKEILEYKKRRNELNMEEGLPLFDLDFQKDLLVFLREATTAIQKLKTQILKNQS